jgi:hypothetical protein
MAVLRRRGGRRDHPDGAAAATAVATPDGLDLDEVATTLLDAAEAAIGTRPDLAEGPEPIPAGAGAGPDAYLFAVATDDPAWSGTLVARTSPVDVLRREAGCIRALQGAGYPVPEVVSDQHERGVVVFRPAAGVSLASCMVDDFLAVPRLLAAFGQLHARLHDLPPATFDGLDLGGRPAPLDELTARADGADAVRDEIDGELTWLAKHGPSATGGADDHAVLCHGELNPVHVYIADGDATTARPVNWTRVRWAEPAFDVAATTTAFWTAPLYVDGTVHRTALKVIRDSLISGYLKAYTEAAAGGLDEDALRYWQAFHLGWLATDLARRVHDEPVGPWEPAASAVNPAGALDDVRRHFWDIADT